MPTFEVYSDAAYKAMSYTVGETITVTTGTGDDAVVRAIRGVWDEVITATTDTDVEVKIFQSNVILANKDTNGILARKDNMITRGELNYRITDIDRDELTTTRYILEEV